MVSTSTTETSGRTLTLRQKWTLAVASTALAVVVGSMAALYTALPEIATATGTTQAQLTWVVDGYTVAMACLVLTGGALGDRFGRRLCMIVGLTIFAVASAVPLLLDDPAWLIAMRTVAGVGAALVMPSTLSILTAEFADEQRTRAIGLWAGVAVGGGAIGILASGVLLRWWSWSSIFLGFALVAGALTVAACTVPESRSVERSRFDVLGSLTVTVAVAATVVALTEAPTRGWIDPVVLGLFALGAIAVGLFVLAELRAAEPLLPLVLFRNRRFAGGALSITLQFLVNFATFFVLVQYLQLVLDYGPLKSALALAPILVPMATISVFAPWLSQRVGLRTMTVVGMTVIAVSLGLLAHLKSDGDYQDLLWSLLIMSLGMGLCTAPATEAIMAHTPEDKHGVAAGVNDVAREVGAAIGIAVTGSVVAAGYSQRIAPAVPRLPEPAREPVSRSLAAAREVADQAGPAGGQLADLAQAAFVYGANHAIWALMGIAVAGALLLAVLIPGRDSVANGDHGVERSLPARLRRR